MEPLASVRKVCIPTAGEREAEFLSSGANVRRICGQQFLQPARVRGNQLSSINNKAIHDRPEIAAIFPAVLPHLIR